MHVKEFGYLHNDCAICKLGERPGILWINTDHSEWTPNGSRRDVLICSSCVSEALAALAAMIPDEVEDEGHGVGEPVLSTTD